MRPRCQAYSWLLTLLSVCSAGAIYAVNDPAADEPKYCTLFHHQVTIVSFFIPIQCLFKFVVVVRVWARVRVTDPPTDGART